MCRQFAITLEVGGTIAITLEVGGTTSQNGTHHH